MVWIVSYEAGGFSGDYSVSCCNELDACLYTVSDISEEFGVDPDDVNITDVWRRE